MERTFETFQSYEEYNSAKNVKPKLRGTAVNIVVFLRPNWYKALAAVVNLKEKVTGMFWKCGTYVSTS